MHAILEAQKLILLTITRPLSSDLQWT